MPVYAMTFLRIRVSGLCRILLPALLSVIILTLFTADESYGYPQITPEKLNLIPFPKQVKVLKGEMMLTGNMIINVPDTPAAVQAAKDLRTEVIRASGISCSVTPVSARKWVLTLYSPSSLQKLTLGSYPENNEGYVLSVRSGCAEVGSKTESGLLHGIRTLQQLIRANTVNKSIPCLDIRDWPSIRYRGFQDDITRSISPTLTTLKREVEMSALLRSNFFTYYLEHQYAFKKHPLIGPPNGSLKPEELKELVRFAKLYNIEIIGSQQSFGHWATILHHERYKHLRETDWVLNPIIDETYQMLDDLYSEQAPITDSKFFNVCCDETEGLGTGPSKKFAEKIGVGGVYAGHMKRIHQILKDKYNKRMMMWGDIILQHPENLNEIPKDTVMLSWGYHAADTFEPAITPFAKSGYDYFVCPGVNNWNRIIPDFTTAVTNIRNYIRDGAKLGAMGVLNTTWDDDAETFFAYNWHGVAWGAECAWNASTTSIDDFNRRIGAVLFGNKTDHFGKAIELLGKTHSLPGYNAMFDSRFWQFDGGELPSDLESSRRQAERLLEIVNPAIDHLRAAKKDAVVNADQLDYFIFAAERMRLIATRSLHFIDAAGAYEEALNALPASENASSKLEYTISRLSGIREGHVEIRNRFKDLWLRESRPYALDVVLGRYDSLINRYTDIITKLQKAKLGSMDALPPASEIGIQIVEMGVRNPRPSKIQTTALDTESIWLNKEFDNRIGVSIGAAGVNRTDQPVEMTLPQDVTGSVLLVEVESITGSQNPVPAQVWKQSGRTTLAFIVRGNLTPQKDRKFFLYYGGKNTSITGHPVKLTAADNGMKWIENEQIRLLIGPEGGHIFRWEVKALGNLDLTEPGDTDWTGFADINGIHRNLINRIDVITSGDALVRLRTSDSTGLEKTFSIWAGVPWIEVNFNIGSSWFACYDNINIMGTGSKTPGSYIFSDGASGAIKPFSADPSVCQIRRQNVSWAAKYVANGPMIALITPEVSKEYIVGPGSSMGAVQTETGYPAAHFIIYGGRTPDTPKETLDLIRNTLDYRKQPEITIFKVQKYPNR